MPENQVESMIDFSRMDEMKPIPAPTATTSPAPVAPGTAPVVPPAEPAKATDAAATNDPKITSDKDNAAAQAAAADTNKTEPPATQASGDDQDHDVINLSAEEVDEISSDVFGMTSNEVFEKLQRLEQLEKEGVFKSEKHKKAFEFISSYPGDDFSKGIARYARLQSSDLTSMDAKSVLLEKFVQENPDLSERDAEEVFEHKFNKTYAAINDPDHEDHRITKIELEKDKAAAVRSLAEMKEKFKADDVSPENNQAEQHAAARQEYLDGLEKTFSAFKDPSVEFSLEDVPGSEFTFKFENMPEVKQSMESIDSIVSSLGWSDGNTVDYQKMAHDIAILKNLEGFAEKLFKHACGVEKERMLREMNNSGGAAGKGQEGAPKGIPQTWDEQIAMGLANSPSFNRK